MEEADRVLAEATPCVLLKTYAMLTHRMHAASGEGDYRAQRDIVEQEILRRMET